MNTSVKQNAHQSTVLGEKCKASSGLLNTGKDLFHRKGPKRGLVIKFPLTAPSALSVL